MSNVTSTTENKKTYCDYQFSDRNISYSLIDLKYLEK